MHETLGSPSAPAPDGNAADVRRGFLKALTTALTGALAAAAALPGLRFLAHPLSVATVTGGAEPLRVARAADVGGTPVQADVVGDLHDAWMRVERVKLGACWLVRDGAGVLRALSTACPHLGCGVDWNADTGRFDCPCHGSVFNRDGRVIAGPAPRGMDELEIDVRGEDVFVRYRRFRLSSARKEPIG